MNRRRLIVIVGLGMLPGLAAGQTIRGVAVDPADRPISGVVVLLLDSSSNIVSRDLSDEQGAFFVTGDGDGAYRVRAMRIGFVPVTSEAVRFDRGMEATRRIVVSGVPVRLDTVRVPRRSACELPPDPAGATHAVWTQARTALLAAELSAGMGTMTARGVAYDRVIDPLRRDRVRRQSHEIVHGLTSRPWTSLSADVLSRTGYVVEETNMVVYYAPDLEVLLSDTFAADHCFRLASSRNSDLIGIAFEPTRERHEIPDIEGTLWLDRRTAELREIAFRYANVPRAQAAGAAGGDLELARMKNGAMVISRWNIRTPTLRVRSEPAGLFSMQTRRSAETRVDTMRVKGGELVLVMRGDDTLWARAPLAFSGRIVDSATGRGVATTIVALRGTTVRTETDARGRFRLPGVIPGEYTVEVTTPSLTSSGSCYRIQHAFMDAETVATIRVSPGDQVPFAQCGTRSRQE